MAGINAARYAKDQDPIILGRDQAYIGVLIDDLVTKGVDEPYRMFTSRAEYRLLLRHDNAAERLAPLGCELGLLDGSQLAGVEDKSRRVRELSERLEQAQIRTNAENDALLEAIGTTPLEQSQSAARLLRRPQVSMEDLLHLLSNEDREAIEASPPEVLEQLEIQVRYEGYIARQLTEIKRHRATETLRIPDHFDYAPIEGLTFEARDKLGRLRPATLGQASRIPGVSPADVSVLLVHLHRDRAVEAGAGVPGAAPKDN
jgi:tRNA uridine 5-carboxymethylaminomethyl modification enzyme